MKVIDINNNNISKFNKLVKQKGKVAVVIFHASWCGHCVEFANKWKDIKKLSKSIKKDLLLARVEEKMFDGLEINHDIKGFPTISLFKSGQKISDYNGSRDTDAFLSYLKTCSKLVKKSSNKINTKKIAKKLKTKKYSKLLKKLKNKTKRNKKKHKRNKRKRKKL